MKFNKHNITDFSMLQANLRVTIHKYTVWREGGALQGANKSYN